MIKQKIRLSVYERKVLKVLKKKYEGKLMNLGGLLEIMEDMFENGEKILTSPAFNLVDRMFHNLAEKPGSDVHMERYSRLVERIDDRYEEEKIGARDLSPRRAFHRGDPLIDSVIARRNLKVYCIQEADLDEN